ncbi:MAG: hypothetical protein ACMUIL_06175 [bacterium]
MKSKPFLNSFLVIAVTLSLVFPLKASAQGIKREAQMGEIIASSGEVLVRTKGRWSRLKSFPHPLFSTDKVVTRQGRAEMRLTSGGTLRLDVDSNLSFVKKRDIIGIINKKLITTNQVNILVGRAWFDIKPEKDHFVTLRTPSFTSKISSAAGEIIVGMDGDTQCGLITGDMITSDNYTRIPNPKPMTRRDMTTERLPESNPQIDNSPLQKAALKNVLTHESADVAASRADQLLNAARIAGDQAAMLKTETARKDAADAIAEASVARCEADVKESMAHLTTTEEALNESQLFGDTEATAEAKRAVEEIVQTLDKIETVTREATKVSGEVKAAANADQALAKAAVAQTKSSVSTANTAGIKTISLMVMTHVAGDAKIALSAQRVLTRIKDVETHIEGLSSQIEKEAAGIKDLEGDMAKSRALAVQVMADAVSAYTSNADALAEIALNAVAKDAASLERAEAAVTRIQQIVETTAIAAENAKDTAKEGNLAQVEEIARIVDDSLGEAESVMEEEAPVLVREPMEEAPLLPPVQELPSLPDSEDLLTASPSA